MLYFLATEESEIENRNQFKNLVADYTCNELLKNAMVDNRGIVFDVLVNYPTKYKKLIVLDEFQYIGRANSAFPSIFQKIWDTKLKDKDVMVILCGSLISLMEAQTLAYSSPLYGRRTGQIKLKQIPFKHYHEFFPDKSGKELIEYYSITGGVPKYIKLFSDCGDIYAAIDRNVLSRQSFLMKNLLSFCKTKLLKLAVTSPSLKQLLQGIKSWAILQRYWNLSRPG